MLARTNHSFDSHLAAPRSHGGDGRSQDSIFEIVFRHRRLFLLTLGAALLIAGAYIALATSKYTGTARLYVQRQGPRIIGNAQYSPPDDGSFLYTQREIIRSTPVLAIALGNLGDLHTFSGERNRFSFVKSNLEVEVGKKDELISISFESPYPEEAMRIVGAVVEGYSSFQSKQRLSTAAEVLKLLQDDKAKNEKELDQKLKDAQAFRATRALLSTDNDRTNISVERLRPLSDALNLARVETLNAKASYDECSRSILADPIKAKQVADLLKSSSFSVLSPADEQKIREQLFIHESQLADIQRQYGANHPQVRTLQGRVDQLSITYAAAVQRKYELAKAKEDDLKKLLDQQQKEALEDASKQAEYNRIQSEVTSLQGHLGMIEGRIKEVNLTEDGGIPNITVLEPAHVDEKPSSPNKTRALAIALIGGLLAGLGMVLVRDRYDYPMRTAREIRQALGSRVLGFIPRLTSDVANFELARRLQLDPASDVAEACRSLFTAICFGVPADRLKTILVTSPARGDGKTTLAGYLAIAMSQQNRRILLINADLRSPSMDRIFELQNRPGLSNVLEGKEIPEAVVYESGIPRLDVIPAGTILRNPADLLNSEKFIDVLEQLGDVYDHIVIDAPPVCAVNDARIIAASADVTLLVLRAGRSNRRLSEQARDRLAAVGANILGIVVNDVLPRSYGEYDGVYDDLPPVPRRETRGSDRSNEMQAGSTEIKAWLARKPAERGGAELAVPPARRAQGFENRPDRE